MGGAKFIEPGALGVDEETSTALASWLARLQGGGHLGHPGELAEALAVVRRALREARPGEPEGLRSLEGLRGLVAELEQRFLAEMPARMLFCEELLARVLVLSQSSSSEGSWWPEKGEWRTVGPWLLGRSRSWFETRLLQPQRSFNRNAARLLERLIRPYNFCDSSGETSGELLESLRGAVDPLAWEPRTHRSGVGGYAALRLQRAWFRTARSVVTPVLERQRRWNEEFIRVLEHVLSGSSSPQFSLPDTFDSLARQGDILRDEIRRRSLESLVSRGLRLLFQHQVAFNEQMLEALRAWTKQNRLLLPDYETWCAAHEPARIQVVEGALGRLRRRPRFSIITPTYETPEPVLRACIDSVRAQLYGDWELCLADDGSTSPHLLSLFSEYSRLDERIRFVRLEGNQGIAEATNAALKLAQGDFVAFLDHDDTLAPHALAEQALRLDSEPDLDVLYSDEDKLDMQGRRFSPTFKPGWSPDLLRTSNYVCHFLVVRRSLIEEIGGIRGGFDGAQDYELVLRLSERTQRIGHIPRVLYHWRAVPSSTASDSSAKPAASDAGLRALQGHLDRTGEGGWVESIQPCVYRVRYPVAGPVGISLVLTPAPGAPLPLLERWGEVVLPGPVELLLVAEDAETRSLPPLPDSVRVVRLGVPAGRGAWARRNLGARHASGLLLLFASGSLRWLQPDWLEVLTSQVLRPSIGVVGGKLIDPHGRIREAGQALGVQGLAGSVFRNLPSSHWVSSGNTDWTRNCSAVSASCLMISRELFLEEGGFDEHFHSWGADLTLCLRLLQRERRIVYAPNAEFTETAPSDSIPVDDLWEAFARLRPWLRRGDPFYNPNLSLLQTDGSLREHPESAEALACQVLANALWELVASGQTGVPPR